LGWRLFTGQIRGFGKLKILSLISAFLEAATIVYDNLMYIAYRAPGGPRAFFMKTAPLVHQVFFELKEFIALLPLLLTGTATFIIWRYGGQLVEDKVLPRDDVRHSLGDLIIAYLLGAAVTKLNSV